MANQEEGRRSGHLSERQLLLQQNPVTGHLNPQSLGGSKTNCLTSTPKVPRSNPSTDTSFRIIFWPLWHHELTETLTLTQRMMEYMAQWWHHETHYRWHDSIGPMWHQSFINTNTMRILHNRVWGRPEPYQRETKEKGYMLGHQNWDMQMRSKCNGT